MKPSQIFITKEAPARKLLDIKYDVTNVKY